MFRQSYELEHSIILLRENAMPMCRKYLHQLEKGNHGDKLSKKVNL